MKGIKLSPSVMCANLTNLEKSVKELESLNVDYLHIDVIDGAFSPSMPLGIDTIKKLRDITDMDFDVHIMSLNNEMYIKELLAIGVQQISFHYESSLHVDRHINLIKKAGVDVGVALNPATSLSVLDYILPELDSVLLMLINPGFATDKNEQQVKYANQKIRDLKKLITDKNLDVAIQVDGRVSMASIPELVKSGADNLVLGSTSLFSKENSLTENKKTIDDIILKSIKDIK